MLGQELAPGLERPVRADTEGSSFIGGGDEPEQELGAGVVERGEAEFVDLCGYPHRSMKSATSPSSKMPRTCSSSWSPAVTNTPR